MNVRRDFKIFIFTNPIIGEERNGKHGEITNPFNNNFLGNQ